jgi:branched-chain amino acid transport system ATP-binding protein
MNGPTIIEARGLHVYYGASHVLHGINLSVSAGEAVGLMGRNGMGKTTLIRSIIGHLPVRRGEIRIDDQDMTGAAPHRIAREGIAYVPEGRGIFPNLTVRENLVMAARPDVSGKFVWTYERVLQTFPRLAERLSHGGQQLSGGEQQMLAIGRALMSKPKLLMLDEPSLGLAPLLVAEIFETIAKLNRESGLTILIVEQNARRALGIADHGYIMESGRIVLDGPADELRRNPDVQEFYLGLSESGERRSYRDVKHYKRRKRWL